MSAEHDTLIRFALEKDVPAILDINNHEIIHSTVNYDYEPKTLEFQKHWFHEKGKTGFPIFVAEIENQIVGFCTYGTFRPKPAYQFTIEHSVYIHFQYRGKGIGYLLMKRLISHAKAEGYHLMVGGIDGSNLNSLHFHKKLGFEEVGRFKETGRKFNQWLDLLFVQKKL